jgi:hypothetical protein
MKDSKNLLKGSMTIVVGGSNANLNLLSSMEVFIIKKCVVRFCTLDRGGTFSHLHIQMVVKLHISSFKMLNKIFKEQLGWDDPN